MSTKLKKKDIKNKIHSSILVYRQNNENKKFHTKIIVKRIKFMQTKEKNCMFFELLLKINL